MSYKTIRSRDAVDKDTTKSRDAGLLLQFPLFTHWHCLLLLASVSCLQMLCFVLLSSSSSSNLQIFKSLLVFLFLPCRILWVENAAVSARYETHTGPHRNDHRELPLSTCMRRTFSFSLHVETGLRENLNGLVFTTLFFLFFIWFWKVGIAFLLMILLIIFFLFQILFPYYQNQLLARSFYRFSWPTELAPKAMN